MVRLLWSVAAESHKQGPMPRHRSYSTARLLEGAMVPLLWSVAASHKKEPVPRRRSYSTALLLLEGSMVPLLPTVAAAQPEGPMERRSSKSALFSWEVKGSPWATATTTHEDNSRPSLTARSSSSRSVTQRIELKEVSIPFPLFWCDFRIAN